MTGGMTPGGHETLAERVANTRARQGGHSTADLHGERPGAWADVLRDKASKPVSPPIRHCWYDGPHGRQAALLLGWRSIAGRYNGRIAVAALEPDGWAIIELWVDQALLSPA